MGRAEHKPNLHSKEPGSPEPLRAKGMGGGEWGVVLQQEELDELFREQSDPNPHSPSILPTLP